MKAVYILILSSLLVATPPAATPRVFSLDPASLSKAKSRIEAKDSETTAALQKLREEADTAIKAGPFAVTHKERVPPSGDRHDYLSLAPYWWPDPKSKDGFPYIRRDGETNPESKRGTDANSLGQMAVTVETLALAWYFTGREPYAMRASQVLRVWFLDPETKMNPHFRYAQAIPGSTEGRAAGLIESRHFINVIEAIGLLHGSHTWRQKDQQSMVAWFREFVQWLRTSSNGKEESEAKNNHGSWYAAQLATFALFIDNIELARQTVAVAKARIAWQIETDGRQPFELQRTKSLGYSAFNLIALMTLAETGRRVGVDLYGWQSADGRSIRRAVEYIAPFADPQRQWAYQQITGADQVRERLALLLRRAGLIYRESHYEELRQRFLSGAIPEHRLQLVWPL
jgi:Alginate lyase